MSLWSNFRTYLRTGVWVRAVDRYSQWETLAPAYTMVDEDAYVREGYRANATVYRCVEVLARAIATPEMHGVQRTPEGDARLVERDPLSMLLARPGAEEYGSQTRWLAQVVRRLMLTGEAILYKVPGERTGRIVELQMLPSSRVEVERDTKGSKTYVYRYDATRKPLRLKPERVIFLKLDDPINPDRGLPPLAAAAREADTDNELTDYRKAFLKNGGVPSGLLTSEQQLTKEQAKEYGRAWRENYSGSRNAGKTPVLAGGLGYQKVGATPGEIALPDLTGISEARICQAFGVPAIVALAKVGSDKAQAYNNYVNARRSFWEDTVSPLLAFLSDELTDGLASEDSGRAVAFDTSKVPALQEDADKKAERIGKAYDRGAAKKNEYREAVGLEPVPDGETYVGEGAEEPVGEAVS